MELLPRPELTEIIFDESAEAEATARWLGKMGFGPDAMADFMEFGGWGDRPQIPAELISQDAALDKPEPFSFSG